MPPKAQPKAIDLTDVLAAALLPPRPARGHKGTFGKLLVIAGSVDYAGAALLVCNAAGRAGAGLVTLATVESLQPLFAAKVVEATTLSCRKTTSRKWIPKRRWRGFSTTTTMPWWWARACGPACR